jgi:WD40 repeat protein/Tfp pilus assembly protein PilF
VAFSPDGRRLASGSGDQTVRVWDAGTGQELLALMGHTEPVLSVAFSPDGRRLASGSGDQTVRVWDAGTGQELLALMGHTSAVNSVAFSPDGRRLAISSGSLVQPGELKVWDAGTGQELLALMGHAASVLSVAFSPDGRRLASASRDRTVKVWDAGTGQELLALKGHTEPVLSVAFSPDGRRLASGSGSPDKGELKVWDAGTGQELLALKGHTSAVSSVAFSPDGRRLASGGWDQTVKVWDAGTGQELLALKGHTSEVESVAFSPDGKRIISQSFPAESGADKGEVRAWDIATGAPIVPCTDPPPTENTRMALSADGQLGARVNGDSIQVYRTSDFTPEALARRQQIDREDALAWHYRQSSDCEKARHWFAAVFHLSRLIETEPKKASHYRRRSDAYAEQAQWDKAADKFAKAAAGDFAKINELEPDEAWNWHRLAWLQLFSGDTKGYRRTCAAMVERFGAMADASDADAVAYTSALSADSGTEPNRLLALAEKAVASDPKRAFYHETFGAALYRAGNYEAAVQQLNEAVKLQKEEGTSWMQLFLAMAHYRLGQSEEAKQWLAKAMKQIDVRLQSAKDSEAKPPSWEQRLMWQHLRREAEALINGKKVDSKE